MTHRCPEALGKNPRPFVPAVCGKMVTFLPQVRMAVTKLGNVRAGSSQPQEPLHKQPSLWVHQGFTPEGRV